MGDSERRQLALAKAYCQEHGLRLSDRCFADRGRSAFHGKHRQQGDLKALLELVRPGDIVLVENIDRWSREDPLDAQLELRNVVNRGVEFAFLQERVRVTKENFGSPQIRYLLFFGSDRANGESERKRQLAQAAWDKKKELARQGKTVHMPRLALWLRWDEEQDKPVVIEAKAALVRRMFCLAAAGKGIMEIVHEMRDLPPISSGGNKHRPNWNPTFIRNLLKNRATTGHYVEKGLPAVPNVWPPIMTEEIFCIVQSKLALISRDTRPGHASEGNLFTGLIRCGRCGRENLILHTGGDARTARLMCCGAGKGRTGCGFTGVPVELVERSFLSLMANADRLRPLLSNGEQRPSKLDELQAQLEDAQKQAAKLAKLICDDPEPSEMIYSRLKQEEARAKELRAQVDREQMEQRANKHALLAYHEFNAALPELAKDRTQRPALRRAIASVIEGIKLDPHGDGKGTWDYEVTLKGGSEPVTVICHASPEGWCFRSLRPANMEAMPQRLPVKG